VAPLRCRAFERTTARCGGRAGGRAGTCLQTSAALLLPFALSALQHRYARTSRLRYFCGATSRFTLYLRTATASHAKARDEGSFCCRCRAPALGIKTILLHAAFGDEERAGWCSRRVCSTDRRRGWWAGGSHVRAYARAARAYMPYRSAPDYHSNWMQYETGDIACY